MVTNSRRGGFAPSPSAPMAFWQIGETWRPLVYKKKARHGGSPDVMAVTGFSIGQRLRGAARLLKLRVMAFPTDRLRRLRRTETLRTLVRETRLTPESFIYPLFICPGSGIRKEVRSMPGVFNLSVDEAVKEVRATRALGVLSVILFGLPEKKDEVARAPGRRMASCRRAARAIKSEVRDVVVMGDVCLCEYMSHGHCGIVKASRQSGPQSLGAAARHRYRGVRDRE